MGLSPKLETRNSKEARRLKFEGGGAARPRTPISDFGIRISFVFRHSGFEFVYLTVSVLD
jgi:hypothetical protein